MSESKTLKDGWAILALITSAAEFTILTLREKDLLMAGTLLTQIGTS